MATRANIYIQDYDNNTKIWLYRHYDGYLTGCGCNLAKIIKQIEKTAGNWPNNLFSRLVTKLLNEKHRDRSIYEITDCQHGDIEYLYKITIQNEKFSIEAQKRNYNINRFITASGVLGSKDFRRFLTKSVIDMIKHYRRYRKERQYC